MNDADTKKSMPKGWKPFWILLLVALIIATIVRFTFTSSQLDKAILYTVLSFALLGLAYYVRVKPPSVKMNKLVYRGLLGFWFGLIIWLVLLTLGVVNYLTNTVGLDDVLVVLITFGFSFAVGICLGDLIGRYRNYKGPAKYSL